MQAELRLETAPVLELRKVLDSSNPRHAHIINASANAMSSQLSEDDANPNRDRARNRNRNDNQATRNYGAQPKTERASTEGQRPRPNPQITDLTRQYPGVKSEPGSSRGGAGGTDCCDLTGDADQGVAGLRVLPGGEHA